MTAWDCSAVVAELVNFLQSFIYQGERRCPSQQETGQESFLVPFKIELQCAISRQNSNCVKIDKTSDKVDVSEVSTIEN